MDKVRSANHQPLNSQRFTDLRILLIFLKLYIKNGAFYLDALDRKYRRNLTDYNNRDTTSFWTKQMYHWS